MKNRHASRPAWVGGLYRTTAWMAAGLAIGGLGISRAHAGVTFTPVGSAGELQGRLTNGDANFASISSVSFTGTLDAASLFSNMNLGTTGDAVDLILPDGILVTSGDGTPPDNDSSGSYSGDWFLPGDADVEAMAGVADSQDAFVLEFDFTVEPGVNAIRFTFLFGSEEYPDYLDTVVDGAAVIVDGVNWAKFEDGTPLKVVSEVGFVANSGFAIEYNGISKPLEITALLDTDLTTHHVKIVIADTSDTSFDTGLFLSPFELIFTNGDGGIVDPEANTAPDASADSYVVYPGVQTDVNAAAGVLANDSDDDGDGMTAVLDVDVGSGALTLNADGSFSYTALDAVYDAGFTYHANDGADDSSTANATLQVRTPTWNGTGSLSTGGNWNGGAAPSDGMDLVVQSGAMTIGANFAARVLTQYKAATISCSGGAVLTVTDSIANEDRTGVQLSAPIRIHSGIKLP